MVLLQLPLPFRLEKAVRRKRYFHVAKGMRSDVERASSVFRPQPFRNQKGILLGSSVALATCGEDRAGDEAGMPKEERIAIAGCPFLLYIYVALAVRALRHAAVRRSQGRYSSGVMSL